MASKEIENISENFMVILVSSEISDWKLETIILGSIENEHLGEKQEFWKLKK